MIINCFLFLSPRLPWRLPNSGKSAVVCLDVFRTSAFNICYALTFSEPRHLTSVMSWRFPELRHLTPVIPWRFPSRCFSILRMAWAATLWFFTFRHFLWDPSRGIFQPGVFKPESVIRTHFLGFVITVMLPACFSPLADICAAISSRRSPLRLRWNVSTSAQQSNKISQGL